MRLVEQIVPVEEFIHGDERMKMYGGKLNPESLQRHCSEIEVESDLPEAVLHHLNLATQIYVSGYFYYDIFPVVTHQSTIAGEVLLQEIFARSLRIPITIEIKRKEEQIFPDVQPSAKQLFSKISKPGTCVIVEDSKVRGTLYSLIDWANKEKYISDVELPWWDYLRELRNNYAHGFEGVYLPNMAIGALYTSVKMFNKVWMAFKEKDSK